jgi:hypothetical protein
MFIAERVTEFGVRSIRVACDTAGNAKYATGLLFLLVLLFSHLQLQTS